MIEDVLEFWYPDDTFHRSQEDFTAWIFERMQGGMDEAICTRFADLTKAAARGELDDWAGTPRGRLALLLVLDQFPRSLWRDTPAAFGQAFLANLRRYLAGEPLENVVDKHVGFVP